MNKPITLDLVTPESRVCSEAFDMIILPAGDGEIGILSLHQPIMTTLKAGEIRLYNDNVITKTITITGGFAEFSNETCRVLADQVV